MPFSTLHYREDPAPLGEVVPGRLHHRVVPGPVPQLVLLHARHEHGAPTRGALQDHPGLRHACSGRTAGRCTRAGATPSSSTRRPSGWASTSCAGCTPGSAPRTTSCSATRPRTRRAGSCWCSGTWSRSWSRMRASRTGRRTGGPRAGSAAGPVARGATPARPLDRRRGRPGWRPSAGSAWRTSMPARPPCSSAAYVDDLSQWYLRRSRRRLSRNDDAADRDAAFATLHLALVSLVRVCAPILPFLAEELYQVLVASRPQADWRARPTPCTSPAGRTTRLARRCATSRWRLAMADLRRAVDLGRTLRSSAGIKVRQPLAQLWLALPGGHLGGGHRRGRRGGIAGPPGRRPERPGRDPHRRRLRPRRAAGQGAAAGPRAAWQGRASSPPSWPPPGPTRWSTCPTAACDWPVTTWPRTRSRSRRRHDPGTAVAADDGIVVVIDTTLTEDLRAEGDARELTRALQDLRRQAELSLDARIEVWVDVGPAIGSRLGPHLAGVAGGRPCGRHPPRARRREGTPVVEVALDAGTARIALRRHQRARYGTMTGRPATTSRMLRLWLVFGAIACIVVVLDQASKAWVESSLRPGLPGGAAPGTAGAPTPVLGDLVRIARSQNDGGIFGLLGDSATVLGIASMAVIAVIVWIEARQGVHSLLLTHRAGPAAGRRHRQPHRPPAGRSRGGLGRHGHRRAALLHLQRGRLRHQHRGGAVAAHRPAGTAPDDRSVGRPPARAPTRQVTNGGHP